MGEHGVAEEPHRLWWVLIGTRHRHDQVTQPVMSELLAVDRPGLRDAVGEEEHEVAELETRLQGWRW